jgi:5-methylthioadenosine/S-adenosylhomocysteine deaminase
VDQEIDLLVKADFLYTMAAGLPIITAGEVAIKGGRIVYAGSQRPAGHWQATRTIERPGSAVLPGFVNAHCHTASILFRSQTDDQYAGTGLASIAFRMEKDISEDDWRVLGDLGCADMLRAGVTTINDIWYAPEQLADSVARCGLRAQIANKVFDVKLENLVNGDYTRYPAVGEARLRVGVDFASQWQGAAGGRITTRIGTHASDTCRAQLHREARAEADRLGIGMHIHAAQTLREVALSHQENGCGPLVYLRDQGLLGRDVVCAHLTFADDADLDAVAETGAQYAHCPTIYPRRGNYPRLEAARDRRISTGFGTDWMLNDPFEGMRTAINVMRTRCADASILPCAEALWLHTMGAATVLCMEDRIGSLEPGKQADLILIDLNAPHLQPYYGDYPALVFYARAADVQVSIVDGIVVLENGQPTLLDTRSALNTVTRRQPGWAAALRSLGSRCVCCGPGD